MNNVNLIPAPRRAARRRRAHLRRCAIGCAAWAVLSLAAAGAARAPWRGEGSQADQRLAQVGAEMELTERAIAEIRARLATAQSALRANQEIAAQPDWSILLALLGKQVKNDVVLKGCHLHPGNTPRGVFNSAPKADPRRGTSRQQSDAGAGPPADSVPYLLEATGLADDHQAANAFVLRLEKTRLFSKVTLLDTARESFLEKNKVNFRIECTLDQSPFRDVSATPSPTASGREAP